MKFFLALAVFLTAAVGQQALEQKHVMLTVVNSPRPVWASALQVERGVAYPAVVKLTGSVEVRTPVCLPTGKQGAMVCDGYMIVRADEAVFHEDTGQIDPHGSVTVTLLQHERR